MFFITLIIGSALVLMAIGIHYEALHIAAAFLLPRIQLVSRRAHVTVGVIACMAAHTIEIWGFAVAYWLLSWSGLNMGFSDNYRRTFLDYLNFSAESYTSLGFGDAEMLSPDMRLLAGIEALTGLVLIAWSASFTYFIMAQYWGSRPRH
ncbi:ion channel [Dongia sp.]|uniref:ion channel n=1 Tax=Dongia sp. TaxID=1977262 RepID=UPI0035B04E20